MKQARFLGGMERPPSGHEEQQQQQQQQPQQPLQLQQPPFALSGGASFFRLFRTYKRNNGGCGGKN